MSQTIVKTRVIPKKITENIVSRGRLLKKFEENASKNIILVMGPAGYGKTTSVLDFLNETNRKYAWLYISPDIDSIASFMSYLVHSIKVLKQDFVENTLELINSFAESDLFAKDEPNSINAVIGSFINEFVTDFTGDIFIVIDDLHNIESAAWLTGTFNSLIDNFPDNLHMIITTRNVPEFNMAKLTAKRKLAKIESNDLNFTSDETESLLKDIYSITYKKEDVGNLIGKIEGWITGLHLILQAYGIDFPKITTGKQVLDEDIFSYFAEDIVSQLDQNTQNFIVTTSMLDAFTPEVCEDVLGISGSNSILSDLRRKNLFIETTQHISEDGSQVTTYSYHNLFKQFLVTKLHETKSKNEIKALAEKIFEYYLKNGDYIQAIEFSLQAGDFDRASEMILSNFETLFQNGRYETLRRWIEHFPAEVINRNYELLFIKGKLLNFFKSDTDKANELFTEIIKNTGNNTKLYIKTNSEISEIMRHTGKPEEALNIFKELYKLGTEPELKISIIISLAKSYYRLGSKYYDEILKLLKEAEELSSLNGLTESIPDIYSLYGRVYLNKGEFVKSLHYFESNYRKESNIYRRFQAINDIVLLHSWSGDYNKAKEYYDESALIVKKYNIHHFERDLLRLNALLRFEAGDYEEAIEVFNSLCNIYFLNNSKSFLLITYLFISESYMFLNKLDTANENILLADKIRDPKDEYLSSELNSYKAILKKRTSLDSLMEKLFLSNLKNYESIDFNYHKTQVEFHLADYYFKKGSIETSIEYLKKCLQTSSDKSYNSFLTQQYLPYRHLFDFAQAKNIQNDYIKYIHSKVMDKFSIPWLSYECKIRVHNELPAMYDIYLQTFGGVSLKIRGILKVPFFSKQFTLQPLTRLSGQSVCSQSFCCSIVQWFHLRHHRLDVKLACISHYKFLLTMDLKVNIIYIANELLPY